MLPKASVQAQLSARRGDLLGPGWAVGRGKGQVQGQGLGQCSNFQLLGPSRAPFQVESILTLQPRSGAREKQQQCPATEALCQGRGSCFHAVFCPYPPPSLNPAPAQLPPTKRCICTQPENRGLGEAVGVQVQPPAVWLQ